VYNGHRPISAPTKERVRAAAKKLGWVPNANASALAGHHTNEVGLLLHKNPDALAVDTFFPVFISGMQAELSQRQIMLAMQVVDSQSAEERAYRSMAHGRADGVVVLDIHRKDWRIPFLAKLRLPAVLMDVPRDYPGFTAVRIDSGRPMEELVDHLRAQGHTRIAHVSGPLDYVHAYDVLRHMFAKSAIRSYCGREFHRAVRSSADIETVAVLSGDFIYSNNVMAIAGRSYAQEQGLRIPEDLALTGFGMMRYAPS
ncbi:MAG: LacI family DNA-binding transcriptional regulator, partial [Bifidobacterium breve]